MNNCAFVATRRSASADSWRQRLPLSGRRLVAGRQEDPKEGFQRRLDYQRARDIARYLDDSVGSIPTNIVLSAQPEAEVQYNSKSKLIKFRRLPKGFLVLDGQHRL